MSYILMADVHAHPWTQFATTDESGINSRLQDILDALKLAAERAKYANIGRIVIAGDLFHVRGSLSPVTLNLVRQTLEETAEACDIYWDVMAGNHDLETADSCALASATTAVSSKRVRSHTSPHVNKAYNFRYVLMPWCATRELFLQRVADLPLTAEERAELDLICHVGIEGVLSGVPGQFTSRDLAELGFRRVFSGHYHNHKVFTFGDCDVVSIGALTHQTWSDVGTRAGYMVVHRDNFFQTETHAPKFLNFEDVESEADFKCSFVRVRGEVSEEDMALIRDELAVCGALGVVFSVTRKAVAPRAIEAVRSVTIEQSIVDWLDERGLSEKKPVVDGALEIVREVRST